MISHNNRYGNLNESHSLSPLYHLNSSNDIRGSSIDLNISYQNYISDDKIAAQKKKYGEELRNQIHQKELKKQLELKKKKEEEMKEELRWMKENEKFNIQSGGRKRTQIDEALMNKLEKKNHFTSSKLSNPKIKFIPIHRSYLCAESLNPFMEIINAKKLEQEKYTNEIIDKMNEMFKGYSSNMQEINEEIKSIKLTNLHSNLYKVDILKELSKVKSELAAKKYQENFKRDHLFKAFMNTKRKKQEMNEFYALNQSKLPIINLSQHIDSPGIRLNNEWYYKDNETPNRQFHPDTSVLNELLRSNNSKIQRLNGYENEYIF